MRAKGLSLMDHNKRNALLTAIDVGNMTRAAELLGYTQSGLSYIIKSLEAEFGFPLLVRSRAGVRPTADCTRILPILRDLHHKSQRLEQEVADIRGLAVGTVSVGVFPCISRFWMPAILRNFTARYPGITLSIQESGQEGLDQWLRDGSVELLLYSRQPHYTHQWIQFMQDDLCAVVAADHPLAKEKEIALDQLTGEPFIMEDSAHDHDIPRLLKDSGFHPNVCWSSKDELAILNMVAAGLGVSVLPGLYLQDMPDGVVSLPLVPRAYRQLGAAMLSLEELSPAAKRFLDSAKATMGVK